MSGNSFGKIFKLTTFGESHGFAIGGVIDGCPAGLTINSDRIQTELNRRKPGQSKIVTQRRENDTVKLLSGIFNGITTGAPIGFVINNENQHPEDYEHIKDQFRPSHADFTYEKKYGIRDFRGGGRASARATASWVVAGAIAKQFLELHKITVNAFVKQVGSIAIEGDYTGQDLSKTEENIVRCPDLIVAAQMIELIEKIRKQGDTVGGVIQCVISGCAPGLGEPVFEKFHAVLGMAMLSINAVKGFEYGHGFKSSESRGSELNDEFESKDGAVRTKSNHSGGIQGGITNGEDIYFNVAFKPVATIMCEQNSVNQGGENIKLEGRGRHDPCVLPRAVPIVEAMAAIVTADFLLRLKSSKI